MTCSDAMSVGEVISVDIALLAVIFLFRALKRFEGKIAAVFRWEESQVKKLRMPLRRHVVSLVLCFVVFFAALAEVKYGLSKRVYMHL